MVISHIDMGNLVTLVPTSRCTATYEMARSVEISNQGRVPVMVT